MVCFIWLYIYNVVAFFQIDALPEIIKQVNGRCEVFLDGGVTKGTDVFKALALGAKMVKPKYKFDWTNSFIWHCFCYIQIKTFIGRPVLWGLAHSGEQGVKNIIQLLKTEVDVAMALSGNFEAIYFDL